MPITADKAALYPADWFEISQDVKIRAGWCCEGSPAFPDCRAADGDPIVEPLPRLPGFDPVDDKRVVLTVAHLDHNPANCARANLKAWCQRCHLTYDAELHALSRMSRKQRLLRAAGQQQLPAPDTKGLLF